MKLSRIAIGGASGIMGLGLLGVGAHAAFTTTTTSNQQISAGYLSVVLHAANAGTNTTKSISLPASATNGSSFTTGTIPITIINNGTVAATAITSQPGVAYTSSNAADSALANEANVCIVSTNVLYNGPLIGAPLQALAGTLAPKATTKYTINVYAGDEHTACGNAKHTQPAPVGGATSTSKALTSNAEGGSINVTETITYTG